MPLLMIRQDITKVDADAVVKPANESLEQGREMTRETLYNTYAESLNLAKKKELESIAFPLLSAGNYGFPKKEALKVAVAAINDFLLRNDMMVYLVIYDKEYLEISQKLFASIEEYIDDHYVEEKDEYYPDNLKMGASGRGKFHIRGSYASEPMLHSDAEIQETIKPKAEFFEDTIELSEDGRELSEDSLATFVGVKEEQLEDIIGRREETFSQMLLRLIDESGMTDSEAYKKANIDRKLFSKIRSNPQYMPSKKTIFCFAVALELPMEETEELLRKAGYAFSNCIKFDVVISYFIENGRYDIFEINEVLFQYDLPLLGGV